MDDNGIVEAIGKDSILIEKHVKGCVQSIRISDVVYVSNLHSNLLSVSKFISRGLKVHFNSLGYVVRTNNEEMLYVTSLKLNLY